MGIAFEQNDEKLIENGDGAEEEGTKRKKDDGELRDAERRGAEERSKDGCEQAGPSSRKTPGKESAEDGSEDGSKQAGPSLQDGEVAAPPTAEEYFEVRKHKVGRKPMLPTKAEIAEHDPLHLHYRDVCKHCVAGKARSNQNKVRDSESERLGVTLNADYAFMGGEYNEAEDGMQASLVLYDDDKESFWATGVDKKGATEPMIKFSVGVIDQSGYVGQKISYKTDQEPSLVALKHATAAARVGETAFIESPVRASKCNGMMENAIKIWQGQLRTIKHDVESRLGICIEPGGALFSWLFHFVRIF